jgi:acyl dehydratase
MAFVNPFLLRHQGPMLATLGRAALSALSTPDGPPPSTPGPVLEETVAAPPAALVDAYLTWSGAGANAPRGTLPPHLFPQWGFPLMARTLAGLPWRLDKVLNQGCRITVHGPLARGAKLRLRAQLVDLVDEGHRVRLVQRLWTGTDEVPDALEADVIAVIPTGRKKGAAKRTADAEPDWSLVGAFRADRRDGWRFGVLTGDLNPIHWVGPYAKLAGFPRQILHGFGSLARSWEILAAAAPLGEMDVRFTRPLVLPAEGRVEAAAPGKDGRRPIRLLDAKGNVCMAGFARDAA